MSTSYRCAECGAELAPDAPQGLCPKCLLHRGLQTDTAGGEAAPPAGGEFVPPTPAELAGQFPELEILELVGRGGMGIVYKARQKHLDRLVALKILSPRIARDPAFAERFTREARAMALLNHPHIVAVYDFGQREGRYYFLMEFVDGVNLRQLLDTGRLEPQQALAIVPQMCEALQYAHDHRIVHRDIKPENLLLDRHGQVKIADFGLAKLVGRTTGDLTLTGTGQVMGTLHYMAPEQMEHPQEVDHRADIYSLGVVFYQLLTGELPLGRFAPPSRKVHVDVRLDEIVLRALEKEPSLRYQQVSQIKTKVEEIAAHPGPGTAPVPGGPAQVAEQPSPADLEQARREVLAPAVGLLATGLVNFVIIAILGAIFGVVSRAAEAAEAAREPLPMLAMWIRGTVFGPLLVVLLLAGVVAAGWMIFGALKMMRLEGYRSVQVACVLAMVVSPGNLIGLPVGIWALVVLGGRHVQAAFARYAAAPFIGTGGAGLTGQPASEVTQPLPRKPEPSAVDAAVSGVAGREPAGSAAWGTPPRLSRVAVVGAVWSALFFVAVLPATFLSYAEVQATPIDGETGQPAAGPSGPAWWQLALAVVLIPLGLAAPFGTTICGGVAVSQIRHARGGLYGLGLALADVLLFPLLALDLLIGWAIYVVLDEVARSVAVKPSLGQPNLGVVLLLSVIVSLVVDGLIFWWAWRAARRPVWRHPAQLSQPQLIGWRTHSPRSPRSQRRRRMRAKRGYWRENPCRPSRRPLDQYSECR